jgi:F420 biosynthesis protein FbiB-like protein
MSFLELVRSRRSIRRYTADPLPQEQLVALLEAAIHAPSAHNRQPWRFAVITTPEMRERLAVAMGAKLRTDLMRDGATPELIEKDTARSYSRITGAAALIVVCLSLIDMDHYPDPIRAHHEYLMAAQSTAMAAQNILLAAHEAGLGACWMCAPLFCPETVCETLGLPADWQPQALLTVGYPAEEKTKPRFPVESRTLWK